MGFLIDRRQQGKNKSAVNRQRFLKRHKAQIRRALEERLRERSITDTDNGESINIAGKDTSEPSFHHGRGGRQIRIFPGNHEFDKGDKLPRPEGGGAGAGQEASDSGEGSDDFVFEISQKEFLELLFEDLELPNLIRKQLAIDRDVKPRRAGFSSSGSPANISVIRSMRSATARRIAMSAGKRKALRALQDELKQLQQQTPVPQALATELEEKIASLRERINRVPFLDDIDLRYHQQVLEPVPSSKAVMFCIMDVSGSMDQATKDLAKRFFILLYLFLDRHYEKTDIVFIRHHTIASEVDEHDFFYARESGGTVVSSALKLTQEVIDERYPINEWNIYAAQASDGDNWPEDSPRCRQILDHLLPKLQYFAYVEIAQRDNVLWKSYLPVEAEHSDTFAMQHITSAADIYPVLRELFRKQDQ
ncbi:MAG: YeaH/YhbH family protein [Gammaproteobacteria bacterium]|nr:YeaH/YhbH family protein [Gammaproteobacteria bacterium]MBQ0839956.1 YeaH/YhbH family protein [Gammaproteobacteria bacterium]